MNKEDTKKAISVMEAWMQGEVLQCRSRGEAAWTTITSTWPTWNWQEVEYRIKPRAMEIEVWAHPVESSFYQVGKTMSSDREFTERGWTKKKFREVLDE